MTAAALLRREHVLARRFVIGNLVASGGMATVYRGFDLARRREVAIKVLYLDGELDIRRFQREASVLAEIAHPGIVSYVAHGRTADDLCYLVEDWLDGGTLAEQLDAATLALDEALSIAHQVALALAAVHALDIVHRDVKPSNIVCSFARPIAARLIDFGIARRTGDAIRMTDTGVVLGTPGYMAPEQANGSRHVDGRADIFALGCVLYECLVGAPAFAGVDLATARHAIAVSREPHLAALCPSLPPALVELVHRMLARDPVDRPPAAVVADELARLRGAPQCLPGGDRSTRRGPRVDLP